MEYKVIKEFGSAKKGDVFVPMTDVEDMFTMERIENTENSSYYSSMTMDKEAIMDLFNEGYLQGSEELELAKPGTRDKLEKIEAKINELTSTYEEDYNSLMEEYNEGNVPQCVKVEAETVYHNLIKVLTSLKELINE